MGENGTQVNVNVITKKKEATSVVNIITYVSYFLPSIVRFCFITFISQLLLDGHLIKINLIIP
jgi:hypothetical protein